jgi:hypothetical protein
VRGNLSLLGEPNLLYFGRKIGWKVEQPVCMKRLLYFPSSIFPVFQFKRLIKYRWTWVATNLERGRDGDTHI